METIRKIGHVSIVSGNIFDTECVTIAIPVNCRGVMGAGLAKQAARKYPDIVGHYQYLCNLRYLQPGYSRLINRREYPHVLLFPTKNHWRERSHVQDIRMSMEYSYAAYASEMVSLAIPPLGCGLGRLSYNQVFPHLLTVSLTYPGVATHLIPPRNFDTDFIDPLLQVTKEMVESEL